MRTILSFYRDILNLFDLQSVVHKSLVVTKDYQKGGLKMIGINKFIMFIK